MKIIVVDDNPLALRLARAILEKEGHQVIPMLSWVEVTTTLFSMDIDMAFVDVNMPGLTGDRLVSVLKGTREGRKAPIILVSDLPEEQLRSKALSSGADDWIRKPLTKENVQAKIEKFFPRNAPARVIEPYGPVR